MKQPGTQRIKSDRLLTLECAAIYMVIVVLCLTITSVLLPKVQSSRTNARLYSNLRSIANAGWLYAEDNDLAIHPHSFLPANGKPVGYYPFLSVYAADSYINFDPFRKIGRPPTPRSLEWTSHVTIAVNRNGWTRAEGPAPSYEPRIARRISVQEALEKRAAYVISANYRASSNLSQGYSYVTEESGCAVNMFPLQSPTIYNRVYIASTVHGHKVPTAYGDTHAKAVPFRSIGTLNKSVKEAENCAGYGNRNTDGDQSVINLQFWGTWNNPLK